MSSRKHIVDAPAQPTRHGSRVVLGKDGTDKTPPPDHDEFKRVRDWGFRSLKSRIQALRKKR
jgi:hypothetical protein